MSTAYDVDFPRFIFQSGFINQEKFNKLKNLVFKSAEDQILFISHEFDLNKDLVYQWFLKFNKFEQSILDYIDSSVFFLIPKKIAYQHFAIPFSRDQGLIYVAMTNPLSIESLDAVSLSLKKPFKAFLVNQIILEKKLNELYREILETPNLARLATYSIDIGNKNNIELASEDDSSTSYISQLLTTILEDASVINTTDIHIEAYYKEIVIKYRVGGMLLKQIDLPGDVKDMLIRHILTRSNGSISEMQLPQDTSFAHSLSSGEKINIRVSTITTISGYSIVMRLLKSQRSYDLKESVKSPSLLEAINLYIQQGNGMFIITGPTSSGKTTMLYNILSYMAKNKHSEKKIMSIEDPVEVILPNITQIQLNSKIGLDFADVIKVSLRQNPDVLMLGEIRDGVSATMAMRAAITGVMVLATLHTRDAKEVIFRLNDLGVPLGSIASSVKLIVSTRLLRKLCPSCKKPRAMSNSEIEIAKAHYEKFYQENPIVYQSVGCGDCRNTGHQGLESIYEFLSINKILSSILSSNNIDEFQKQAVIQLHGKTLLDQAVNLWCRGHIAFEDVSGLIFSN